MKILMKKDQEGYADGITKQNFLANHEYEVSDALGKTFIDSGVATLVKGKDQDVNVKVQESENLKAKDVYGNKMAEPHANKSSQESGSVNQGNVSNSQVDVNKSKSE